MFHSKSKIFAASVLGVSILLVGSLVSFTIYLVTKSNAAYDGTSVGYIFGGSYDESNKMLQQLLKDKVVQHALVVPTLLHSQNESHSKVISVSPASHLLLVQTSTELIPSVKAAVQKASKDSYPQKVWTAVFSATAETNPFLSFALPTAPPSQPATKDAPVNTTTVSPRVVEIAATATDRLSTLPVAPPSQPAINDTPVGASIVSPRVVEITAAADLPSTTNSVSLSTNDTDGQNGNILPKLLIFTNVSNKPGEFANWSSWGRWKSFDIGYRPHTGMTAEVFFSEIIKVKGTRRAGYTWMLGPKTSPSLGLEYIDKKEDGSVLDDALVYLKVRSEQLGYQYFELIYADPAGSGPPLVKIVAVNVV